MIIQSPLRKWFVCIPANSLREGWWDAVTVIVWGATVKLLATDNQIQGHFKQIIEEGVNVSVCRSCAEQLEVLEKIEKLGIEHKYWGAPLTDILNSEHKLITI